MYTYRLVYLKKLIYIGPSGQHKNKCIPTMFIVVVKYIFLFKKSVHSKCINHIMRINTGEKTVMDQTKIRNIVLLLSQISSESHQMAMTKGFYH